MHREVLTKRAAELFGSLRRFPGFYLAGGTALALQIGPTMTRTLGWLGSWPRMLSDATR